jgi:hypothetical protein
VEGNRRPSRNGPVSDLPPETPNVTIRNFFIAVGEARARAAEMVLERGTNRKLPRRTCSPRYELQVLSVRTRPTPPGGCASHTHSSCSDLPSPMSSARIPPATWKWGFQTGCLTFTRGFQHGPYDSTGISKGSLKIQQGFQKGSWSLEFNPPPPAPPRCHTALAPAPASSPPPPPPPPRTRGRGRCRSCRRPHPAREQPAGAASGGAR